MAYEAEEHLNDALANFPAEFIDDQTLMGFMDELFKEDVRGDHWHGVHDALEDYVWNEYGVILDDYIDWADYGDWYEATH